jgi:hypothetical protein
MKSNLSRTQFWLTQLWIASRSLTTVGLIMIFDLAACLIAMQLDSRQITGIDAWVKPAKFALSSAITCLSLAWIVSYLKSWPRARTWSARVFAASIAVEIVVIDMQAARGTTSHFNMATPWDAGAFIVMGVSIATLWLSMATMTYALWRQQVTPSSWALALRLGLLLSLIGAAGGGFMLRQSPGEKRATEPKRFGAHTVGAPDGGPGLPIANWSTQHGDLRIPHFLGLHALQVLPLVGWWLLQRKRLTELQRTRLAWLAGGTYIALFTLLSWQALRGQALLEPDTKTIVAAAMIAITTGAGTALVLSRSAYSAFHRGPSRVPSSARVALELRCKGPAGR